MMRMHPTAYYSLTLQLESLHWIQTESLHWLHLFFSAGIISQKATQEYGNEKYLSQVLTSYGELLLINSECPVMCHTFITTLFFRLVSF